MSGIGLALSADARCVRIIRKWSIVALSCVAVLTGGAARTIAQTPVRAEQREFAVPSGMLAAGLVQFGRQAGVQISYIPSVAANLRTAGVSGTMSNEAALSRLLAGTGLIYRFQSARAVVIERPAAVGAAPAGAIPLDTIDVQGDAQSPYGPGEGYIASRDATATKTDTPVIEIPQTINVVTRDQITAQGAQSLTDATRYTPGIIPTFSDSDTRNDVLQSRGYYVRYNLNGSRLPYGAYSSAMQRIEPYGLDRIDVLKGPSSVLYGQNTPGGLINMVSKRPTATPLHEVVLQTGSHGRVAGAFDLSGPANPDGTLLYRLTGLARESDGRVDFGYDRRVFIAPALTWQPDADTSLTVLSHYQKDSTISDYSALPALGTLYPNINGRLPPTRYAGEPNFDGYEREQGSIGYDFKHRFNDVFTVRQLLQVNRVEVDAKSSPGFLLDPTQRYLSRVASHGAGQATSLTVDTNLEARFETGSARHTVLAGVDYLWLDDNYKFASNVYGQQFDLYNPVYGQATPSLIPRINYNQRSNQTGLYLQDQIKIDHWVVTLGGRYDWANARTTNQLPALSKVSQDESAFTGRAGLTYLFDNGFAPYVSYATSFQPLDGTDFSGQPFKAMTGEQYEAGIKYQAPGSRSVVTLSAFQLTQQNSLTPDPDPTHSGFNVQQGEGRVRGLELEGKTNLWDGFDVIASYAYMDSEVTKANPSAPGGSSLLGNKLVMVPRHQAALWADYTIQVGALAGFGLGGGVRYMGSAFGDAANTLEMPAHALFDAAVHYDLGKLSPSLNGLTLRVTATNLFDKEYVGYCQSAMLCYYGQGRTVLASMRYRW